MAESEKNHSIPARSASERWIAILLVACLLLVGFWEVMSSRSDRPWAAFQLGAADFESFSFECDGWSVVKRDVSPSPIEPEILKFDLIPLRENSGHAYGVINFRSSADAKAMADRQVSGFLIRARLVHGYNMVDCMRIKGYAVKLLHDSSNPSLPSLPSVNLSSAPTSSPSVLSRESSPSADGAGGRATLFPEPTIPPSLPSELDPRPFGVNLLRSPSSSAFIGGSAFPGRIQIWELENSVGDKSIWVTSMLRAGDFAVLDVLTTDMAFPRVGVPDNPDWLPTGVSWKSFRHPIRNFHMFMRSKWNGARCDLMVFLKLKQPPWADEETLTLVTNSRGRMGDEVLQGVLEAHGLLYGELVKWRRRTTE